MVQIFQWICKKAGRRVSILMRMRKMISIKVKLWIYKTATLQYLTYCSLVWHFCRGSDRRKLERVNERGLRAVFCDWRSSYDELLARARMTSLYNRRLKDIAILMRKLIAGNIIDLFSVTLSTYNLRNSGFFIPRFNTNCKIWQAFY